MQKWILGRWYERLGFVFFTRAFVSVAGLLMAALAVAFVVQALATSHALDSSQLLTGIFFVRRG
jgi:hypothetical protein